MRTSFRLKIAAILLLSSCGPGMSPNSNFKSDAVSCDHGAQGQVPNYSSLISQFANQRGFLLNQDCSGTSNNFIGELVTYLRLATGDTRIGYNGNASARDTITYLWDNSDCEGSSNVSVIDVIGGYSSCQNHVQWAVTSDYGVWTLTPPANSNSGGNPPPAPTPNPTPPPTPTPTPPPVTKPSGPPNMQNFVQQISSQYPGLINNCVGQPVVTQFLTTVIRALQAVDSHWGFLKKPDGRIPRDILAYAWGSETEGTHNAFVIDFVVNGCDNTPTNSYFNDPAPNAGVGWQLTNPDGIASNGVWSRDP